MLYSGEWTSFPKYILAFFKFVEGHQVTFSHRFCEMFHQEPYPTAISTKTNVDLAKTTITFSLLEIYPFFDIVNVFWFFFYRQIVYKYIKKINYLYKKDFDYLYQTSRSSLRLNLSHNFQLL